MNKNDYKIGTQVEWRGKKATVRNFWFRDPNLIEIEVSPNVFTWVEKDELK